VSSSFVPSTDFTLAGSPAPEIALYNVAAENGRSRPGVVCYVATRLEPAVDDSGPRVWKRTFVDEVEYEIIAKPVIDSDKYLKLHDAIASKMPGVSPTLIPCEFLLNSVDVPGTLSSVRVTISAYYNATGDIFWIIRLQAEQSMSRQLEDLMKSKTGLLLPATATLEGINLPMAPYLDVQASLPVREKAPKERQ
jgi:hypothetical protein